MPLNFGITAYGFDVVSKQFEKSGNHAMVPRKPMMEVVRKLAMIETQIFDSEGKAGSSAGAWRKLSPTRIKFKEAHGLDPRKLRARGALYRSLTSLHSSNMIKDIEGGELTFGSRLPYAAVQNFGGGKSNIPARPFLEISKANREDITDIIANWLLEPFPAKSKRKRRA